MKTKSQTAGKKKEDRSQQIKIEFEPVNFEGKIVETCTLMLQSSEDPIILKALSSIDKFGIKASENLQKLFTLGVIELLLPLIHHHDIYIKRYSTKLLAELSVLEDVKSYLIRCTDSVNLFIDILQKDTDIVVQEFSSFLLAELTTVPSVCTTLLEKDMLKILFVRITSADPDVQKNSLQIMRNTLNDPSAARKFCELQDFSFKTIISLFRSDYPVIQQLSISVVDLLTKDATDSLMQELFRNESGLQVVVELLEIFDWKDLHPSLLTVLANCAASTDTALYLQSKGYLHRLLQYMDKIHEADLVKGTLYVISGVAKTDAGKKVLHENQITEKLLRLLEDESAEVIAAASLCISFMCKFRPAVDVIYAGNPIQPIAALLRSDKQPWYLRFNAAHALHELLWCDIKFCISFVEQRKQEVVLSILQLSEGEVPHEILMLLIQILRSLCVNDETRMKVAGTELVETLHNFLKGNDAQLQTLACQTLGEFASESYVRQIIVDCGCLEAIMGCLKALSIPVKLAAATLIQTMVFHQDFVKGFILAGGLQWMLDNKSKTSICPIWDSTIEAIFNNFLPAKFAYKGRLDMNDVTSDVFYLSRSKMKEFIFLEELLFKKCSPVLPIYVANFNIFESGIQTLPWTPGSKDDNVQQKSESKGRKTPTDKQKAKKVESTNELLACYNNYPSDPYLPHYLQQVKLLLAKSLIQKEVPGEQVLKENVKILAKFVAKQMAGVDSRKECSYHSHNLHITEIKKSLGTNIIPLGHVRNGLYLERAMLFKVLADRISIPCALVRGNFGHGWIEISVVEFSVSQDNTNILCKVPLRIQKPNSIVDLMHNVGEIWPLGSYEAKKYCGVLQ